MKSLRVRLRLVLARAVFVFTARTLDSGSGSAEDEGGSKSASFSLLRRLNADGLMFSLSSTTISSSEPSLVAREGCLDEEDLDSGAPVSVADTACRVFDGNSGAARAGYNSLLRASINIKLVDGF